MGAKDSQHSWKWTVVKERKLLVISYLKKDIFQYRNNIDNIFQYRNNIDKLMEKLVLLENIDFTLTRNGKFISEIADHLLQAPTH